MRVTACLMWYDESPADLYATVKGLEGIADRIVAVNGRWKDPEGLEFPEADPDQSEDEAGVIYRTARKLGMDATIHRFAEPVVGEIFHRNYALRLALADCDWFYLTDADERIVQHANVRDALGSAINDVGTVRFTSLDGPQGTATQWEKLGEMSYQRRFFRANRQMRFETHHWYLVDNHRAYWGDTSRGPSPELRRKKFAPAFDLDIDVEHRTALRPPERWAKKQAFIDRRDPADEKRGWEY